MAIDIEKQLVVAALLGHAVGDALGVPVEFQSRAELDKAPVTDMRAFGTHHQPAGTWSDDTSLTLCTAEALCGGFDLERMGHCFIRWLYDGHWTPHGDVFDIGVTTREAITALADGAEPTRAGLCGNYSNGNGSLMRILPVALYLSHDEPNERQAKAMQASCLTHGHVRSQLACAFYCELVARLLGGLEYSDALHATQMMYRSIIEDTYPSEAISFMPILDEALGQQQLCEISGSGYVLHCLRASLWCVARARSYEDAVLMAVNLGEDTDTTGAVAGGLAALRFGGSSIPERWLSELARREEVAAQYGEFAKACLAHWQVV